jgi:mersacidin/lichenicidin family type 2 lantibiotic
MSQEEKTVKAWKDADFRANLSDEDKKNLPENPAGVTDADDDLDEASGGTTAPCVITTVVTYLVCVSIASGGTCEQDTSGCC